MTADDFMPSVELEAFLEGDKSERQVRWRRSASYLPTRENVNGSTPVEPQLVELVTACIALGVQTFASCEGHDPLAPDYHSASNSNHPYLGLARRWPRDWPDSNESELEASARQGANRDDVLLVNALLDEFYPERERPPEHGLYLDRPLDDEWIERGLALRAARPIYWGGRMASEEIYVGDSLVGERSFVVYDEPFDRSLEPRSLADGSPESAARLLPERQQEMVAFGAFLRQVYFDGPPAGCAPELCQRLSTRGL
jgi:hypothetical protein